MTEPIPGYSEQFWAHLEELEDAVDALVSVVLAPRGSSPNPSSTSSSAPQAEVHLPTSPNSPSSTSNSADHSSEFWTRMRSLSNTLRTLHACLIAPANDLPEKAKRKNLKRLVHPVVQGSANTALRARVGRAAKRAGISFQSWVERYGMVDKRPASD